MIIHPVIRALIGEIEEFLDRTGMTPAAFGKDALNDAKFLADLHRGRLPSVATMDKVRNFMRHTEKGKRETASA